MLQKLLRITAICLFIALVFSPIYSRHIRQHFKSLRVIEVELENLTTMIPDGYKTCDISGKIKIPSLDNSVQVIHIISSTCKACIDDIPQWKYFIEGLHKHLLPNKGVRVEILNLLEDQSRDWGIITNNLIGNIINNNILQQQLKDVNVQVCNGFISRSDLESMNVDILPSIIIIKNGDLSYSTYGRLNKDDIDKLSNTVSSLSK